MSNIKLSFRTLEKQVCSLKWAKRLHEIGVRQDTYFHWVFFEGQKDWNVTFFAENSIDHLTDYDERYAAYTVQDFIDIFPKLFKVARSDNEWKFLCEAVDMHLKDEDNMANVFARFLISITKNKDEKKRIESK